MAQFNSAEKIIISNEQSEETQINIDEVRTNNVIVESPESEPFSILSA